MTRGVTIGNDGLLHCTVCGNAVEKIIKWPIPDSEGNYQEKKVHVICECEANEKRARELQEQKTKELKEIQKLRSVSLLDDKLTEARLTTFTATEENEKLLIVRNYIENFERMFSENQGLLLWGPVGTGKSYAAAVITNELLDRKVPVVMTSFIKLLREIGTFDENNGKIDQINRAKLLVIDDLGAERGTDYTLERVYDVIDSRYRSNRPIILTTNLTMEQMKECEDIRYNRIYDRIFEMCYPVKVTGLSWRKREAAMRYSETKKLLEG